MKTSPAASARRVRGQLRAADLPGARGPAQRSQPAESIGGAGLHRGGAGRTWVVGGCGEGGIFGVTPGVDPFLFGGRWKKT